MIKNISSDHITVGAQKILEDLKPSDSIAVNGTCLTVTVMEGKQFSVNIMPETMRLTNLGRLRYGDKVNLERALVTGGRFGGHFVQGHVDNIGRIISMVREEGAIVTKISTVAHLMKYIVHKGFVAVDGCSLTVVDYDDVSFSVSLVIYTAKNTTLGQRSVGDMVNIEVDIIAKYIEKLNERSRKGVTWESLEEYGFLQAR